MDRLTSLTAFVRVVDSGGFSAAGRKLNMSTTMVSHIVQYVAPVVAEFLASYPEVKVDLTMGERTVDMIDEGYDVAIRLTPPPDSSLIVRSLATWRHVLCCSHGYLEMHPRPQQLSDLSQHNCIRHELYPYGDEWHFADRKGAPATVRVAGNLVTNSGDTLRMAALYGAGVFLAAGFLVHDDLEAGRLVRLLPEYRPVEFAMNAVYPHRHHLSAKVRIFIDLLARHSADQQKLINPYS